VAGFYDPGSERLALVRGVGIDDVTLAHELTHALEDQHYDPGRFGDGRRGRDGTGVDEDAASAETGLVEGTATVVMTRYLERYPEALTFGDALGQRRARRDSPRGRYAAAARTAHTAAPRSASSLARSAACSRISGTAVVSHS
jgi:hypothetical protein